MGFVADSVGWDRLDGAAAGMATGWWTDTSSVVTMLEGLLEGYHPDKAADIMHSGNGYVGGGIQQYFVLQIIRQAIENAGGAENLDGQFIYDTASSFKLTMDGFEEWSFSSTDRMCVKAAAIYQASAQAQDLVRVTERIPLVTD